MTIATPTAPAAPLSPTAKWWALAGALTAGAIMATGGSTAWATGGEWLAVLLSVFGFLLAGGSVSCVVRADTRKPARRVWTLALIWAGAAASAFVMGPPLVEIFESFTVRRVASPGFAGILVAVLAADFIAVLLTGLILQHASRPLMQTLVRLFGVAVLCSVSLVLAAWAAIILGYLLGETLKIGLQGLIGWRIPLVAGWAIAGGAAGWLSGVLHLRVLRRAVAA